MEILARIIFLGDANVLPDQRKTVALALASGNRFLRGVAGNSRFRVLSCVDERDLERTVEVVEGCKASAVVRSVYEPLDKKIELTFKQSFIPRKFVDSRILDLARC